MTLALALAVALSAAAPSRVVVLPVFDRGAGLDEPARSAITDAAREAVKRAHPDWRVLSAEWTGQLLLARRAPLAECQNDPPCLLKIAQALGAERALIGEVTAAEVAWSVYEVSSKSSGARVARAAASPAERANASGQAAVEAVIAPATQPIREGDVVAPPPPPPPPRAAAAPSPGPAAPATPTTPAAPPPAPAAAAASPSPAPAPSAASASSTPAPPAAVAGEVSAEPAKPARARWPAIVLGVASGLTFGFAGFAAYSHLDAKTRFERSVEDNYSIAAWRYTSGQTWGVVAPITFVAATSMLAGMALYLLWPVFFPER
jgi:hypothetical protein